MYLKRLRPKSSKALKYLINILICVFKKEKKNNQTKETSMYIATSLFELIVPLKN